MKDKIVVITGASEGLGKIVAMKLATEGARIALVAYNESKLNEVTQAIGENARAYVCDVSIAEQVRKTSEQILDDFGHIDILINNAGIWTDEELENNDPNRRRKVFEINALGTIEFVKAFEPSLKAQNSGQILNVISTSGTNDTSSGDNTRWQSYGASKWALAGFTRALKDSFAAGGVKVKVTGFYPGGFDSNLYENANRPDPHGQPWMMQTEDVANALIFCLTRPADILVEKLVVTKFA